MRKQNIEITGSKRVKSTQISSGDGSQNLKVVESEDVESEQIIGRGEKRDKTPDSQQILENLRIENLENAPFGCKSIVARAKHWMVPIR